MGPNTVRLKLSQTKQTRFRQNPKSRKDCSDTGERQITRESLNTSSAKAVWSGSGAGFKYTGNKAQVNGGKVGRHKKDNQHQTVLTTNFKRRQELQDKTQLITVLSLG